MPSVDLSIMYPVIGEPPLLGAVHDRLICDDEAVVATSPVGAVGTVIGGASVVALAVLDGTLVPAALIADTL